MTKKIASLLFFLSIGMIAYCGTTSSIKLIDGSVIEAEIISLENGIYTFNSPSLGTIKIAAAKIQNIQISDQPSTPQSNAPDFSNSNVQSQVERLKTKIAADPATMKTVTDLANDPQFQEIMKDPEIANAAKSGDAKALMSNPKFMSLTNNPKIREIAGKLSEENK